MTRIQQSYPLCKINKYNFFNCLILLCLHPYLYGQDSLFFKNKSILVGQIIRIGSSGIELENDSTENILLVQKNQLDSIRFKSGKISYLKNKNQAKVEKIISKTNGKRNAFSINVFDFYYKNLTLNYEVFLNKNIGIRIPFSIGPYFWAYDPENKSTGFYDFQKTFSTGFSIKNYYLSTKNLGNHIGLGIGAGRFYEKHSTGFLFGSDTYVTKGGYLAVYAEAGSMFSLTDMVFMGIQVNLGKSYSRKTETQNKNNYITYSLAEPTFRFELNFGFLF